MDKLSFKMLCCRAGEKVFCILARILCHYPVNLIGYLGFGGVSQKRIFFKSIFGLIFASLLPCFGDGFLLFAQNAPISIPYFDLGIRSAANSEEVSLSLQILLLLTILTIAPSIIIMTTSFIRVVIILKFVQRALSLQQEPPNQVILGLALFISFFIMSPTLKQIYNDAYLPYSNQEISTSDFFEGSMAPLKSFMLSQSREKDLDLFIFLAKKERPASPDDVSMVELMPAFIIGEITRAFQIGIYLFIPFIVIDMIVASILMSMGMILIPPIAISLPFKIILFVLIDGWHLITLQTVRSFQI